MQEIQEADFAGFFARAPGTARRFEEPAQTKIELNLTKNEILNKFIVIAIFKPGSEEYGGHSSPSSQHNAEQMKFIVL